MAEEQSNGAGSKPKQTGKIHPIAAANDKTDEEFIRDYLKPSPGWTTWTHPLTQKPYSLEFTSSHGLTKDDFRSCFDIIELTSGADYRDSSVGWRPSVKNKEMRSPDLRYILVKDDKGTVKGFTSLMPTFENHEPVLYCYEVHLVPELQGSGLGRHLMAQLIAIAENIPLTRKVMLTCFTSNTDGLGFYGRLGFAKDDFSPRDRTLRGGKVVKPDYVILSRGTAHGGVDGDWS
ncbi:acetyltransferase [Trichoderma novae-zelandiae]